MDETLHFFERGGVGISGMLKIRGDEAASDLIRQRAEGFTDWA